LQTFFSDISSFALPDMQQRAFPESAQHKEEKENDEDEK